MSKRIIKDYFIVGKYTVLIFDNEIPYTEFSTLKINGNIYKQIISYDIPNSVAIENNRDFNYIGQEVLFF